MRNAIAFLTLLALATSCKTSEDRPPDVAPVEATPRAEVAADRGGVDLYGDPLPEHAIARLGSVGMIDRAIENMVFLPDGTGLVANTRDGYAVWNVADAKRARLIEAERPSGAIALSPSGKIMATGVYKDGAVVLWDFAKGSASYRVNGHKKDVTGLCFLGEDRLATASADGTLRVWDLAERKEAAAHRGRGSEVTAVACHGSGKDALIVFGTDEGAVHALPAGAAEPILLGAAGGRINEVAIGPRGTPIAASSADGTARIWPTAKPGEPIRTAAHERLVYSLAFSPDGKKLYTTGGDWWFRVWDSATGNLALELPGIDGLEAQRMALSPDGRIMASWSKHSGERGSEAGRFWLWNAREGTLLLEPERHTDELTSVAFSRDGKLVATASRDRSVRLWDASSGKQVDVLDSAEGSVNDLEWSRDGKLLYSAGADALLSVWEIASSRERRPIDSVGGAVNAFDLSPDESRLATGDQIGRAWSWDLRARARISAHDRGGYSAVYDVAYSPDGKLLAIAGSDRLVRIVDNTSGKELAQLNPGDTAANHALAFSPDGKALVTGGDDHGLHVWNTTTWARQRNLAGHDGTVQCITFSADGTMLVTGGNDEMVRVWDFESGKPIATFAGHDGIVTSVDITADGKRIASASGDATGLVWKLPPREPASAPPK